MPFQEQERGAASRDLETGSYSPTSARALSRTEAERYMPWATRDSTTGRAWEIRATRLAARTIPSVPMTGIRNPRAHRRPSKSSRIAMHPGWESAHPRTADSPDPSPRRAIWAVSGGLATGVSQGCPEAHGPPRPSSSPGSRRRLPPVRRCVFRGLGGDRAGRPGKGESGERRRRPAPQPSSISRFSSSMST